MIPMTQTALRLVLLAGAISAAPALSAATCPETSANLAMEAGDLTSVQALYQDVEFNSACSNALRVEMRDRLATLHLSASADKTGTAKIDHLKEALRLGRTWEYQVALGEALMQTRDFDQAAKHLQNAINRINDNPTEGTIDKDDAMRLVRLASTAMALSEGPVEVPTTRSGTTGGIFAPSVRGFAVVELDVHVTFEFDSIEFTPKGAELARTFATALQQQQPPMITLEGHTDPQGGEEYNMG